MKEKTHDELTFQKTFDSFTIDSNFVVNFNITPGILRCLSYCPLNYDIWFVQYQYLSLKPLNCTFCWI
jgi:hypothetical protein